jgi:methionine aminopeptidase
MNDIEKYIEVQNIAKKVLNNISLFIKPDSTENSIASKAVELLNAESITKTWYHNTPALVLLGSRSCLSVSGKDYRPENNETVGHSNMVTIDISPMKNCIWGDCARSYFIENGKCSLEPSTHTFTEGKKMFTMLHNKRILLIKI